MTNNTEQQTTFNGMKMSNLRCYFTSNLDYVEEFDTEDGIHWEGRLPLNEWTEEIYEAAVECGFVDSCLERWKNEDQAQ